MNKDVSLWVTQGDSDFALGNFGVFRFVFRVKFLVQPSRAMKVFFNYKNY